MSLMQKIEQDLKSAMISKDAVRLSTVRSLKSAVKYGAIEKKVDTLSDAEIQQVIQKQVKQRRESLEQFSKADRPELAEQERAELAILEAYLPKQMSDAELEAAVAAELAALGCSSKKDFGRMMKHMNEKLQGAAEPRRISDVLNRKLT